MLSHLATSHLAAVIAAAAAAAAEALFPRPQIRANALEPCYRRSIPMSSQQKGLARTIEFVY